MDTEQKPDFEKIIISCLDAHTKGLTNNLRKIHAIQDHSVEMAICDAIWTDYVTPLRSENKELKSRNEHLLSGINKIIAMLSDKGISESVSAIYALEDLKELIKESESLLQKHQPK
jgi:hypothetical protein